MNAKTPGGQHEYRVTLCMSFLFKFFNYVNSQLPNGNNSEKIELEAAAPFHRDTSFGSQCYQETTNSTKVCTIV